MQGDDAVLWRPSADAFTESAMARFAREQGFDPRDYDSLHCWSVVDKGAFWGGLWDFAGVIGDRGRTVFESCETAPMTGARFFPKARLNLVENLLRGEDDRIAAVAMDETGKRSELTRGALRARVIRVAQGLRAAGVEPGDRVAGLMPNDLDALTASLATLAIGAVWSACSPDFGAKAIVDRIGQVAPKALFAAPRYRYSGRVYDISERIAAVCESVPSIATRILTGAARHESDTGVGIDEVGIDTASHAFVRFPFDMPAYILYTSGTTGRPKAIVHGAGGPLMKHLSEHMLHADLGPDDRLLWHTNIAWMMYPWMVGALACGASIVLYDGAPVRKTEDGLDCSPLWRLAETAGVTHLGVSPKHLATLQSENFVPRRRHNLCALRYLMVCGAPCLPHQFDWVYENVITDAPFASISGGTEILGCFLIGSPLHPVRRGQITVPALGMAPQVLDARGASVVGRRGELVCTEPFPSMPLTFWGDGGDERYRETYFGERPEIWTHGDVAEFTVTGGAYVHGRSDTTLNPGGVRIGTSEVYAVCETCSEIDDFVMFGAWRDGDEDVVLAIRPQQGYEIDSEFAAKLRQRIRSEVSPRHVPARIHVVGGIPYTVNGKRVEGAARAAINGGEVVNLGSLANPQCIDEYRGLRLEDAL